jgi:hypothetical protein
MVAIRGGQVLYCAVNYVCVCMDCVDVRVG